MQYFGISAFAATAVAGAFVIGTYKLFSDDLAKLEKDNASLDLWANEACPSEQRDQVVSYIRNQQDAGLTVWDLSQFGSEITVLPPLLPHLTLLNINGLNKLTTFPDRWPENLMIIVDNSNIEISPKDWLGLEPYRKTVGSQLDNYIEQWHEGQPDDIPLDILTFKEYFTTLNMWGTSEAIMYPEEFAQKQLNLLHQMANNPELREECFTLAAAGMADCHDNALAMFQRMQEKALEISMNNPGVSVSELIDYGLALENRSKLDQLIEANPELMRGIHKPEGTEAKLVLQLLCHRNGIALPVPTITMEYPDMGAQQFKDGDMRNLSDKQIRSTLATLITSAIPVKTKPDATFLASQPFWQNYIDRVSYNTYAEQKARINEVAYAELETADDNWRIKLADTSTTAIEISMLNIDYACTQKTIEQDRKDAIASLYLKKTTELLKIY